MSTHAGPDDYKQGIGRGYQKTWRGRGRYNKWQRRRGSGGAPNQGGRGRLMPPPGSQRSQISIIRRPPYLQQSQNSSQRSIRVMLPTVPCPYKGWYLYMTEGYCPGSETVKFIRYFEVYFKRNPDHLRDIEEKQSFMLSLKNLSEDEQLKESIPNLSELIVNSPQKMIDSLGLAAHQVLSTNLELSLREEAAEMLDINNSEDTCYVEESIANSSIPQVHARLSHLDTITPLKNLKASYYGKLVSVKGTVVRVSSIKPFCKQMAFSCIECNTVQGIVQPEGYYTVPTSCPEEDCSSRLFAPNLSHKLTKTVNWQNLRLQEIISDDQREGGRIPRTVECEVMEDLADSCIPGDMITLTGIVKVHQNEETKGNKAEKSMFNLYIDSNSVTNCKSGNDFTTAVGIEFSLKDYYAIEKIQSEPQLFKLLVASLCPPIYGHEMVKAGLLLCLFGGCSKLMEGCVPVRGEPHILLVGDPGLGKSQMLQACSNVAPRGVYVCGSTTTTAGLTVTLSREAGKGGDYALEGGALVLADQGICCIDEFDKMGNQHQALLEAMEQQCISLAKAGIVCSLPARTSVLAAANPVGGHYNKAKTVSENIKMSGPLLSRFDLVFILLDKPDEEFDSLLSEHVMAMHSASWKSRTQPNNTAVRVRRQDLMNTSVSEEERANQPLSERLKYTKMEDTDPIPHQLLRKYISYARKYVQAHLTQPAAKVLQSFYLELRKKLQNSDATPITTRQLESLIRLSEARARCELREEVTEMDAKEVVEIMKFSMIDTYSDEFGYLDFQRSQHGSGTSSRSQMKKFVAALQRLSDSTYKSLFSLDEMRQLCRQLNIQVRDFGEFVESLNHQGYLLKKGAKVYQLLTSN